MHAPIFDTLRDGGFKKVVLCNDTRTGLRAVIAIHSTLLGPATGGVRFWPYHDEQAAIADAMRLARGMTYKYAIAGINLGGGKAVIIGDPRTDKSEALLRAFGRFVDQQGGEYISGEDVGTTLADMEVIRTETPHIVTLPEWAGGVGDISPATARGAVHATRAAAQRAWGDPSLKGRRVALQGLGVVGEKALKMLLDEGAEVTVTDIDPDKTSRITEQYGVTAVAPDAIYDLDVDIFAPYALGAVINDTTIPRLKAKVVAGAANNILAEPRHGHELQRRGIVYAVDYVANGGGTILDTDRLRESGFNPQRAWANVEKIFDRTLQVFALADKLNIGFQDAADRLAEERLAALIPVRLLR